MFSRKKISPLPILFFTVFMDLLGFGLIIPILPQLLGNPASPFYLLQPGVSAAHGYILLGLLLASFPVAQFFCAPILGQLSDVYGRRKIILVSVAGTTIAYVIFALGVQWHVLWMLFFAQLFMGATGGNVAAAQAAVADFTPAQDRARNFGLMVAATGLGFIVGPFLGGILSDPAIIPWFNATTPFWCAAIFSILNVVAAWMLTETLKHFKTGWKLTWDEAVVNIKIAWRFKKLRGMFGALFLFDMGLAFLVTFVGIFLISKFSFNQLHTGEYYAFAGLCIALSQALLPQPLSKRFGDVRVLRVGFLGSGLGLMAAFFLPSQWMLWVATPFFAVLIGLTQAHAASVISRLSAEDEQGEVFGVNASLVALSQAIPPVLSGLAAASFTPETPVFIAASFMLVAGVLFLFVAKRLGKNMSRSAKATA